MKTFLKILTVLILLAIGAGFYFKSNGQIILGDRIIGIAVLCSTFILLPAFLYHSWKGKRLKDYTFSDENWRKMKEKNRENK